MLRWRRGLPAWAVAESPRPVPVGELGVARVDDATISPFDRGGLRASAGAKAWMTGAVHDAEGRLVPESQRIWDGDRAAPVAADPERLDPARPIEELAGAWVYAGHWRPHFGHFVLETVINLWPEMISIAGQDGLAGIVVHRKYRGAAEQGEVRMTTPPLRAWQEALLELSGYGGLPIRRVHNVAVRVERLHVPARPVVLKSWAHPRAVEAWRRMASRVSPATHEKVFLSRRRFHREGTGRKRRVRASREWDERLEDIFAEAGFEIVHPETLPIRDQLAWVRGANVLAGSSGSALHLSAFAEQGTRVLEIGDSRSPTSPMRAQRMIDAACAHRSAFVPHEDTSTLRRVLKSL